MYGLKDLKQHININEESVECPILGCIHKVARQRKRFIKQKQFRCPIHDIYISPSTFEYTSDQENILWNYPNDLKLLSKIKSVKRESRMARDNSEDSVTWNVFRYLERTGLVHGFSSLICKDTLSNAEVIYWSYSQGENDSWTMLNQARTVFGETIRRGSEPDIIIDTDKALFFIEAKLTAKNVTRPSGEDGSSRYTTGGGGWFTRVFQADFHTVAVERARYELLRFWLLGTWLAQGGKAFYLISLVCDRNDRTITDDFSSLIQINPHARERSQRMMKIV